jgi:hypothetical protein
LTYIKIDNVRKGCRVLNGFKKNPYENFVTMIKIYIAQHGVSLTLFTQKFLGPLVAQIRDITT